MDKFTLAKIKATVQTFKSPYVGYGRNVLTAMFLETAVIGIDHIGSYNCRKVRMMSGIAKGMSAHATAEAIDIIGFRLADDTIIDISEDWYKNDIKSQFLHAARDGACDWFQLTLSPDYNNFHTNHLHLQSQGWGSCL